MSRLAAWLRGLHARFPMTRGAAYAMVFLFVLSFLLAGGSYWLAVRNAATVEQLCEAGNEARAEQIANWDYIIKLSGPPPTAHGRAVLAEFEHHLRAEFAPRNCSAPLKTRSPR